MQRHASWGSQCARDLQWRAMCLTHRETSRGGHTATPHTSRAAIQRRGSRPSPSKGIRLLARRWGRSCRKVAYMRPCAESVARAALTVSGYSEAPNALTGHATPNVLHAQHRVLPRGRDHVALKRSPPPTRCRSLAMRPPLWPKPLPYLDAEPPTSTARSSRIAAVLSAAGPALDALPNCPDSRPTENPALPMSDGGTRKRRG